MFLQPKTGQKSTPVRVLYFTRDPLVLKEGSLSRERLKEYGTLVSEIHVVLISSSVKKETKENISENVWLYVLPSIPFIFQIFTLFSFVAKNLIWKNKLHTNLIVAEDPFLLGLYGYALSRRYKQKLFVHVDVDFLDRHFKMSGFGGMVKRYIGKNVIKYAAGVKARSEKIKNTIVAFNPRLRDHVTILPLFLNVDLFINAEASLDIHTKFPNFMFIMLLVTDLDADKNIVTAFSVLEKIIKQYPRTGLVIVGEGPEKESLQKLAKRLHISNNVVFESPTSDVVSYIKTANMLLIVNEHDDEGFFGVKALAESTPVITSRVGPASAVLENGIEFSPVCDARDVDCFVRKIGELLHVPGLREYFQINGKYYAKQCAIPDQALYQSQWRQMWESAISGNPIS